MLPQRDNLGGGVLRRRARYLCGGWFLLGLSAISVMLVPLHRDLCRRAEVEALSWLKRQGDRVRPHVQEAERRGDDAVVHLLELSTTAGDPGADRAQVWLVSAIDAEPGLIVPVSLGAVSRESLGDFRLLQTGIAEARGSATRPLVLVGAADGLMAVAYLRLVGTGYGIAMSMEADQLYRGVAAWLTAYAALAITILAVACAGLYRLIVAPCVAGLSAVTPAGDSLAGAATPAAAEPADTAVRRAEAVLHLILYQADLMENDPASGPGTQEHLQELRATARQGLDELRQARRR